MCVFSLKTPCVCVFSDQRADDEEEERIEKDS